MSRTPGSLTAVEQRGIEPVPDGERNGNPLQLFWVWFAANISILGLPLGATLVAVQFLNVWQSIVVAVIGAAGSFALVGVVSVAGRRGGAPSMTLSRATFGNRGNFGPTVVSLLSRLGWETVNTTTGAFVLISLFTILFGSASRREAGAGPDARRHRGLRTVHAAGLRIGARRDPGHPEVGHLDLRCAERLRGCVPRRRPSTGTPSRRCPPGPSVRS